MGEWVSGGCYIALSQSVFNGICMWPMKSESETSGRNVQVLPSTYYASAGYKYKYKYSV